MPVIEMERLSCAVSVYSSLFVAGVRFTICIGCMNDVSFVMVVLNVIGYYRRRLNGRFDVFKRLFKCLKVTYVPGGGIAA